MPELISENFIFKIFSSLDESKHVDIGLGANCFFSFFVTGLINSEFNFEYLASNSAKS